MGRIASGLRRALPATAAVAAVLGAGAAPAAAQSKACPSVSPTWTDPCGPTFVLPGWGDAGGWRDPEQYETIQLADVDGDGADELLARTPAGVAIHEFDTTLGQWRPQVTPVPSPTEPKEIKHPAVILTAFANPPPLTVANPNPPATDWTQPQYYDTIQAADIDGDKRAEILGRGANGVIVYDYTPGAGGTPGSWRQVTTSGPLPDSDGWGDGPYYYATIQTGDVDGDRDAELVARGSGGVVAFNWTGSGWRQIVSSVSNMFPDGAGFKDPKYWTTIQLADIDGDGSDEVLGRYDTGVVAYEVLTGDRVDGVRDGPFADRFSLPDCPFGAGSNSHCLGDGAAYYATLQFDDVDGNGREELLVRASDGMRVRRYQGDGPDSWGRLPTLTDLSDQNGYTDQSRWETIQLADINGDKRAEVLARDAAGLNAWAYDPARKVWNKLPASPALQLADDPWAGDRSYYSTIQTGDVDGDGSADLVARGPYGIRTWFYNRRKTGGWERYLESGYPDFSTRPCGGGDTPPCGERAAFSELTARAQGQIPLGGTTIRGVWTGQTPPSTRDLSDLADLVTRIGNCTNQSRSNPTQYVSCTPPAGSSGFTASEWTRMLNEIFAEIFWAEQTVQHYSTDAETGLGQIWSALFVENLANLDVLAGHLKLAGPAQSKDEYNAAELWSVLFGLAGALVTVIPEADPILVAAMWSASEGASMLPSASPDLNDAFEAKLDEVREKFAGGLSQADDAMSAHNRFIRRDQALLTLVGQLRATGTWELDRDAMTSVGRQGFARWIYKELLPTIWARYVITGCENQLLTKCQGPPMGAWEQGTPVDFTTIAPLPTAAGAWEESPCSYQPGYQGGPGEWNCLFTGPDTSVAGVLWGPQSQGCIYPNAVWDFANGCTLGVDPRTTLADPATVSATRRWGFETYTGDPVVRASAGVGIAGRVSGVGARVQRDRSPSAALAQRLRRSIRKAVVRLRATVAVPRSLRARRAKIVFDRLLFEPAGGRELVRHRSGRKLPPLMLVRRGRGSGNLFTGRRRRGPRVRLGVRQTGQRLLSMGLVARNVALPLAPNACNGTRPGVDLATEPITLHTRLRIDDGRRRPATISLKLKWTCHRDRLGEVRRLVLKRPTYRAPRGRSPAVAVRGPRRLVAGKHAMYRFTVRNRRRTTAYDVRVRTILPRGLAPRRPGGARVSGGQVVWHLRALRPRRSKTFRLRVRAARSAAGRACPRVTASAIDTRAGGKRFCIRVVGLRTGG